MTTHHEDFDRTRVISTPPETDVVRETVPDTAVDHVQTTAYDPYAQRRWTVDKLVQAVYLVFGLVEILLVIRFLLRLLGANAQAEFARFIYGVTAGLVAPFVGLFGTPSSDGSVLEVHTIVAIIVYALVAWLIARVIWLVFGETRSAVATSATTTETRSR